VEFKETAKLRIEHWMKHTDDHVKEYSTLADELENSGYSDGARNIRKMATISVECSHYLKNALLSVNETP